MRERGTHARVWRATGVMSLGTAFSRATGLVRVAATTYALGVARLADTYTIANTTPNILYELFLGGVFTAALVPVITRTRLERDSDEGSLVATALAGLVVVSCAAALAAPLILRLYTFRIPDLAQRAAQQELGTYLARWFAPQIFFLGFCAIATAQLAARDRFGPPHFAPVLNNVVVTLVLVAFARTFGERSLDLSPRARLLLGAGTTAGLALQAIALIPFLRGLPFSFRIRVRDPAVVRLVRLSGWWVVYVAANQIGLWVVYALANRQRGAVTAYAIAFLFFQLPHALFAVSLLTAIHPRLSESAATGRWEDFRDAFATSVRGIAYLLAPVAVGYAVLARPLSRLLLARGVASAADATLVASVLEVFVAGLLFFSAFQVLTRCFGALLDTRTPTMLNLVAVAINVAVDVPLFARFGVRGLALGHAISYAAGVALLLRALDRRVGGLRLRAVGAGVARIVLAAAGAGLATWAASRAVTGDVQAVVAGGLAGAAAYALLSLTLGFPEFRDVIDAMRRRTS